jgi:hypothetical protein
MCLCFFDSAASAAVALLGTIVFGGQVGGTVLARGPEFRDESASKCDEEFASRNRLGGGAWPGQPESLIEALRPARHDQPLLSFCLEAIALSA